MLKIFGILFDGLALMLSENMPIICVVQNTTVLWSVLKKKHLKIGHHSVREAIAAKEMRFVYIRSEENLAHILT